MVPEPVVEAKFVFESKSFVQPGFHVYPSFSQSTKDEALDTVTLFATTVSVLTLVWSSLSIIVLSCF